MINVALKQKKIYDVVKKYVKTGATVIWERQSEARPPKPYVSLDVVAGPIRVGHKAERVNISGKVELVGEEEILVSMNYFGTDAYAELGRVKESFDLPKAREILVAENIVYVKSTDVKDLSALMENRWESRSQIDVTFRLTNIVEDLDSGTIGSVELTNGMDASIVTILE